MVTAPATVRYTGLVTRAIALAIDALLINLVAVVVGAIVALALSTVHLASDVEDLVAAISGVVYVVWSATYFISFWSTTGQTPGAHVMQFKVHDEETGEVLSVRRAALRLLGVALATIPFFAGFVPILFNDRRRGLQDWMARTVVVDTPDEPPPAHGPRPTVAP
jgi:uncharacterized RDD family membrane protein YckC